MCWWYFYLPQHFYHVLQSLAFVVMAVIIMRLKLFGTPALCVLASLLASRQVTVMKLPDYNSTVSYWGHCKWLTLLCNLRVSSPFEGVARSHARVARETRRKFEGQPLRSPYKFESWSRAGCCGILASFVWFDVYYIFFCSLIMLNEVTDRLLRWNCPRRGGGGYSTKCFTGRLRPDFQPLTRLYSFVTEKVPISYTFYWQMVPLSHTCFERGVSFNCWKNVLSFKYDLAGLATERERHLTTGKRAERTKLDFRHPICRSAIGQAKQASCLICARSRQQTFPFCC